MDTDDTAFVLKTECICFLNSISDSAEHVVPGVRGDAGGRVGHI